MLTQKDIAHCLYLIDPMNIGTVENALLDEYELESMWIVELSEINTESICSIFEHTFYPGAISTDTQEKICLAINNLKNNSTVI